MDFGRAFGFVFEDEEWVKKILLGALISLIPIVGQFVLIGYGLAVLRNVKEGNPRPLPDWGEFGAYLAAGVKYWVITLVYAIPIFIILCPITLISLIPALSQGNEDWLAILSGITGILGVGLICLVSAYGILLALLTPVLQIRFAETGDIGACLRFKDVFAYLRQNLGSIFIALLVSALAAGVIVSILGAVTLGILALPASVWATAFSSHLYGQIARSAAGPELPVGLLDPEAGQLD